MFPKNRDKKATGKIGLVAAAALITAITISSTVFGSNVSSASSANVTGKITIADTCTTKKETMTNATRFGNGDIVASGEAFNLMVNGSAVTDPGIPNPNYPGLLAKRGNGYLTIAIDSDHTKGRSGASGVITLEGATVTSVVEGFRHNKLEDKKWAQLCKYMKDGAYKASANTVNFTITAGPNVDSFTVFYKANVVATPTATPTPTPVATPSITPTPTATPTVVPTPTPVVVATPTPTPTIVSTCVDGNGNVIVIANGSTQNCNVNTNTQTVSLNVNNSSNNSSSNDSKSESNGNVNKITIVKKAAPKVAGTTVHAVSPAATVAVPVSAKTGAEDVVTLLFSTLFGGSGMAYIVRKTLLG